MNPDPAAPSEHSHPSEVDVLVVGAGPTGLVAAAEALRHGLSVRIIEKRAARAAFSKALVVHARTLEVFATMGIAEKIRAVGAPFAALNTHFADGRRRVRVDLLQLPWGDTDYPYWLSVPQYDTERVLEAHLADLGATVEFSCALESFTNNGDTVDALLRGADGTESVRARWVIGADGGRSTVRDLAGITLKRTGSGTTFLLADVKSTSDLVEDEGHVHLARQGLLIIVPMPEPGRWRLIAHLPGPVPGGEGQGPVIDAGGLDEIIRQRTGVEFGSHDVTWTSRFDLTHGVADRFRSGHVFLVGDAAHIHSPVGGQGLNTGVQDAHNLMWKIAQSGSLAPQPADDLLDSYEAERRGTAVPMVRGVARMTSLMTVRGWLIHRLRGWLAPMILARPKAQARLGRGVGMLNLSYAGRAASVRRSAGGPRVGDRMPNPELRGGGRLFDRLANAGYTLVVLGDAETPVPNPPASLGQGVPVIHLPPAEMLDAPDALRSPTVVLVRPDRHTAAVGPSPEHLAGTVPPATRSAAGAAVDSVAVP